MSQLDIYYLQHSPNSPANQVDEPDEVVKCFWCDAEKINGECPNCDQDDDE